MRTIRISICLTLLMAAVALATVFATLRGIVHDPQHRPIADAEVVLKAENSVFSQITWTTTEGEFHFEAIPVGAYRITVNRAGFAAQEQTLTVLSGTAPILHFELQVARQAQTVTVTSDASSAQAESVTPTTLVTRSEIAATPGAALTNSLSMITNYVPGAYLTHDQLHMRGGHQVSWLLDGVSIPNTNIGSNLGPQIDPKDMDALEVQRGSYSADYGDHTYGIFNVAPRTGFERNNEVELLVTAGNFYQTDDQLNFGGHTNRFAYYASLNGNRTELGLETPTTAVIHDQANGYGGFTSLTYNVNAENQLRLVAQLRQDFYQVPFDPRDPNTAGQFLSDSNEEHDGFVLFSWVRTVSPGLVATVSPFYHYNKVSYASSSFDHPSSAMEDASSNYEGGQANLSWIAKRNNLRAGLYGFAEQASQLFGLSCNPAETDCSSVPTVTDSPNGNLAAAYVEDQFKATSWLSLNAGVRQTHFSASVVENATSPRVGASLRVPKLNWVFRVFYGHFYQPPPLLTISGPLLNSTNSPFIPLHGERDDEHQYGVTIPLWGWTLDADTFLTRAKNFFDHNNFNNSNLFFPVTIQGARISGWELTLRSPQIRKGGQVYLTYSNQLALSFGCITGGLIAPCSVPPPGFDSLDHDQRNTLHIGGQWTLPRRSYVSTDVYYGSGFTNGNPTPTLPGDHLQPHTTFDLTLGKDLGEHFALSVTGLNVANRRVLLDNSFTFGGTHYNNPREIFVQLRYRFHY